MEKAEVDTLAGFQGKRGGRSFHNKKFNPGERARKPLLNLGRLAYFKYDLNQIIDRAEIEDSLVGSFKASIIAKSSKVSIQDAKDYIREIESREQITNDLSRRICSLLDRYTTYR